MHQGHCGHHDLVHQSRIADTGAEHVQPPSLAPGPGRVGMELGQSNAIAVSQFKVKHLHGPAFPRHGCVLQRGRGVLRLGLEPRADVHDEILSMNDYLQAGARRPDNGGCKGCL